MKVDMKHTWYQESAGELARWRWLALSELVALAFVVFLLVLEAL